MYPLKFSYDSHYKVMKAVVISITGFIIDKWDKIEVRTKVYQSQRITILTIIITKLFKGQLF